MSSVRAVNWIFSETGRLSVIATIATCLFLSLYSINAKVDEITDKIVALDVKIELRAADRWYAGEQSEWSRRLQVENKGLRVPSTAEVKRWYADPAEMPIR